MSNQSENPVKSQPRKRLIPERVGNELMFSKGEFAAQMRISRRTVDNLLAQNKLRATKIGRRTLIHKRELERLARQGA